MQSWPTALFNSDRTTPIKGDALNSYCGTTLGRAALRSPSKSPSYRSFGQQSFNSSTSHSYATPQNSNAQPTVTCSHTAKSPTCRRYCSSLSRNSSSKYQVGGRKNADGNSIGTGQYGCCQMSIKVIVAVTVR